jgi:hypothetical protein
MQNRFVFLVVALVAVLLIGCHPVKNTQAAEQAVTAFHQQLDTGDFKGIYAATHADFKKAATEKEFVDILEAVHRKLGNIQSTQRATWNINSYNFQTNVSMTYDTTFEQGKAKESFNYRIEDGKAVLRGYNINSPTLITK